MQSAMKYRLSAIPVLVALCFSLWTTTCAVFAKSDRLPKGHEKLTINMDGRDREYLLYVPSKYDKSKAVPLVIMLHGLGGTALNSQQETGWSAKAEQETFLVAYPEATRPEATSPPSLRNNPQAWNDGSGRFHLVERKIDDVAFLSSVIDQIGTDYNIDSKRIYCAGFSNGASMAFRVGAKMSDRVAAIAPSAGACWIENLRLTHGISLCYITGTADTLNPVEGGFPVLAIGGKDQGGQKKPPIEVTIDKWAKALECGEMLNYDKTRNGVHTRRYGPGRDGAEVEFTTVEGLGHHWAGGQSQAPEWLVGKNTKKLKATDEVWEFFLAHPRR